MALTDEQAKTIKEQLLKQIEAYPEDKREYAKNFILGLTNEKLEEFLVRNNLLQNSESSEESRNAGENKGVGHDCIFCALANKLVSSFVVYEDKSYLACLEINPLNKGHVLLIPKKHILKTKSLKQTAFSLADKIGKHLIKHLDAQSFQISSSDEMKHAVINIIPIYKNQKPEELKKAPAKKEELAELAKKVGILEKKAGKSQAKNKTMKAPKIDAEKTRETLIRLPRRIP